VRAWRGWSEVDPSLHYAFYELGDLPGVYAGLESDAFKALIADLDRTWGARVPRSREIVASKQMIRVETQRAMPWPEAPPFFSLGRRGSGVGVVERCLAVGTRESRRSAAPGTVS
jgi:hypothetical protein